MNDNEMVKHEKEREREQCSQKKEKRREETSDTSKEGDGGVYSLAFAFTSRHP